MVVVHLRSHMDSPLKGTRAKSPDATGKVAPKTMREQIQETIAAAEGSAATERAGLVQELFQKLRHSVRREGVDRLKQLELRKMADVLGFRGENDEWEEEYQELCLEANADPQVGLDLEQFTAVLDSHEGSFSCTTQDLRVSLRNLGRPEMRRGLSTICRAELIWTLHRFLTKNGKRPFGSNAFLTYAHKIDAFDGEEEDWKEEFEEVLKKYSIDPRLGITVHQFGAIVNDEDGDYFAKSDVLRKILGELNASANMPPLEGAYQELVEKLFYACKPNEEGRLTVEGVFNFATLLGFNAPDHTAKEWIAEYMAMCHEHQWDEKAGVTMEQFVAFLVDSGSIAVASERDLQRMIAESILRGVASPDFVLAAHQPDDGFAKEAPVVQDKTLKNVSMHFVQPCRDDEDAEGKVLGEVQGKQREKDESYLKGLGMKSFEPLVRPSRGSLLLSASTRDEIQRLAASHRSQEQKEEQVRSQALASLYTIMASRPSQAHLVVGENHLQAKEKRKAQVVKQRTMASMQAHQIRFNRAKELRSGERSASPSSAASPRPQTMEKALKLTRMNSAASTTGSVAGRSNIGSPRSGATSPRSAGSPRKPRSAAASTAGGDDGESLAGTSLMGALGAKRGKAGAIRAKLNETASTADPNAFVDENTDDEEEKAGPAPPEFPPLLDITSSFLNLQHPTFILKVIKSRNEELSLHCIKRVSGPVLNQTELRGATLLHLAAEMDMPGVCTALLDRAVFAGKTAIDYRGWTALHRAARLGNAAACKSILLHPCFTAVDYQCKHSGWNALHLAAMHNHREVCFLLMSSGRCKGFAAKDNWGRTALHCACEHGHGQCVQALVANGRYDAASVNTHDVFGLRPHDKAKGGPDGFVSQVLKSMEHYTPPETTAEGEAAPSMLHVSQNLDRQPSPSEEAPATPRSEGGATAAGATVTGASVIGVSPSASAATLEVA
eukprot:TRINITY_DN20791_c0_g1_i2.p1 TRINITY_DN20791_c0_g1~~TRINITY_DN20791_c0_g1_i2.p1  ORF type:complete len:952 (-),score=210.54 TRINITY_DN20791_c0_g1_i2:452-3307(-)